MKKSVVFGCLLVLVTVFSVIPSAGAATLQLKDGRLIHGKYLGGTEAKINFQVEGKLEQYRTADVLLLDFGDSDTSTPATNGQSSAPRTAAAVSSSGVSSGMVTVPAGTLLTVRMIDSVDSRTNKVGDTFQASLEEPLVAEGRVLAPKGADVYGRLNEVKEAGRVEGQSELRLELTGVQINRQVVPIVTGNYDVAGKSRGKNTAEKVGGGAVLGALIGAIAGGGKGAAIGAGVGAGAGAAAQVLTHGQQVHVPSEAVLDFTLKQPVSVPIPGVAGQ